MFEIIYSIILDNNETDLFVSNIRFKSFSTKPFENDSSKESNENLNLYLLETTWNFGWLTSVSWRHVAGRSNKLWWRLDKSLNFFIVSICSEKFFGKRDLVVEEMEETAAKLDMVNKRNQKLIPRVYMEELNFIHCDLQTMN